MYRFILFDLDNTLFDFTRSEKESIELALTELGFKGFDRKVHLPLYRETNKRIWKEFEEGTIEAEELKIERFRRYLGNIGSSLDPSLVSRTYLNALSESVYVFPGVPELLRRLAERFSLSIVTNGLTSVQKPRIAASQISPYFRSILISEELGIAKPDPEFLRLAMETLGAEDRREVIIVGDNPSSDIAGGMNAGIDTVWYNPSGKEIDPHFKPTYTVSSLEEIPGLL